MELITNLVNFLYLVRGLILFVALPIVTIILFFQFFTTWRKTRSWEAVFRTLESTLIFFIGLIIVFSVLSMYDFIRSTDFGKTLPDLNTLNKK